MSLLFKFHLIELHSVGGVPNVAEEGGIRWIWGPHGCNYEDY
jgi:hypothetical protein